MGIEWTFVCRSCRQHAWLGSMKPAKWGGFQAGNRQVIEWISADTAALAGLLSADVTLEVVGMHTYHGREACLVALAHFTETAQTLTIRRVLSHGRCGAVDGQLIDRNGSIATFCHIYEFAQAKGEQIRRCTAYWITTT
ncbi:MAG: hypothetical protein Fur005_16820 [Roseiflexaceae bacterium]